MSRPFFDSQLLRLSRAFASVPQPGMGDEYWGRLKHHRDALFVATVDKLLDEGDRFPSIAAIHRAYYQFRDAERAAAQDAGMPRDAAEELGRRNATRLATEGLPSDVMMARGGGVVHRVGSSSHDAILRTYDKLAGVLERQLDERVAQSDARPNDHDLSRRVAVLIRTLDETLRRRDHFAETGETLPLVSVAPDAVGVVPGTMYRCPVCRATDDAPGRYVRLDATAGSAHFGSAIPCPQCRPAEYAAYVAGRGQPTGLPRPGTPGAVGETDREQWA
jgi:hypothetical protein